VKERVNKHKPKRVSKPPAFRRLGLIVAATTLVIIAAMMIAALVFLRGPFEAPVWVKDRITASVERALPDRRFRFEGLRWNLGTDGRPVVSLRNAVLLDLNQAPVIELSELESTLSLGGLLVGEVRPKTLGLSGLFLDVKRDADGGLGVSLAGATASFDATKDDTLVSYLKAFELPALSSLETVSVEAITLQYDDLRAQRSWTVDGGRFRMSVKQDEIDLFGDLALLAGGATVATLEANALVSRTTPAVQFGVSFDEMPAGDLASQQAALVWLSLLDAQISGSMRGGFDDNGNPLPIAAALKIGEGVLRPTDATRPIPFRSMESYFSYNPRLEDIRFDQISIDSDWISGSASGHATLELGANGLPNEFNVEIDAPQLSSTESGPWQRDIVFKDNRLAFDMQVQPFRVSLRDVTISYQNAKLAASGSVSGGPTGWEVSLGAYASDMDHQKLLALWPALTASNTRTWLEDNVRGAKYSGTQLSLESIPSQPASLSVEADVKDAVITYAPLMSPARQVSGKLLLDNARFEAEVESGIIYSDGPRGINVKGTRFVVPDVSDKEGWAEVELSGRGSLSAVLHLLEQIPALEADETELRGMGMGEAALAGTLSFPIARKPEANEYVYDITGTVAEVSSDTLVPGQEVTADLIDVSASNEGIHVHGNAQIGGVDLDAIWTAMPSDGGSIASTLTGEIELSQEFVSQFGLGLPDGTVTGQGVGTLFVDLPKGEAPRFELISNLDGMGLNLNFVGWRKKPSTKGDLRASGRLGQPMVIDLLEINAAGFEAKGQVLMTEDGSLDAVDFSNMRLGTWLNAPVRIQGNGAGQPSDIYINGGVVDVQSLTEATGGIGGSSGKQVQGRIFTDIDQLFVSDFLSMSDFSGEFDLGRNLQGQFSGRLNDTVDIGGTISTDAGGRRLISATADDAGAVLSALGLLDKASKGTIYTELTEKSQGYGGRFVARDVRLLEMPLLADLLNAVSIVGLFDQLSFDGIGFSEVEGEFYFTETEFILSRASATGPSMGLSLDGTYDFENDQLDLQGVLTPIYLVNGIGEIFTRRGEGVIGFNFTVTGSADNPEISVNPLSALTPSIFRELFRKPSPKVPE
jgi:hypothetical protein